GQDRQQRRLARAVRAEQAGDPAIERQIDRVQRAGGAVPPGQAVDVDGRGAHVHGHLVHPHSNRSRRRYSPTAVHIDGLSRRYGATRALDAVDLALDRGITGLLGPNGAGKTTLLSILATVNEPDAGRV